MANNPFIVGGGSGNSWNYSDPSKEGYSDTAIGTVVKIVYRQGIDFNTKQPKFYDDGHPATVFAFTIQDNQGNLKDWVVDNKKTSQGILAIGAALGIQPGEPVDVTAIYGKFVNVHTSGLQNIKKNGRSCTARIWQVQILGNGTAPVPPREEGIVNEMENVQAKPAPQVPAQVQQGNPQLANALQNAMNASMVASSAQVAQQQSMTPQQFAQSMGAVMTPVYDSASIYADEDIPF